MTVLHTIITDVNGDKLRHPVEIGITEIHNSMLLLRAGSRDIEFTVYDDGQAMTLLGRSYDRTNWLDDSNDLHCELGELKEVAE